MTNVMLQKRLRLSFPHLTSHALTRDEEGPAPCQPLHCAVPPHLCISPTAEFCVPAIPTESSPREIPNTELVQKTAGKDLALLDKPTRFYSMQQRQLNSNAVPLRTVEIFPTNHHQFFGASPRKFL